MKNETIKMLHAFMEDKLKSPESARLIIKALKEEGMSTEEILLFINTLTPEYEVEIFGVFASRIYKLDEVLKNVLADSVEWEKLSAEEMLKIISLSESRWNGHYHDSITSKAVRTGKLSIESMMQLVSSGKLDFCNNHAFQSIIQTNRLSTDQINKVVEVSGYYWPVVMRAIETKLFPINQMMDMWEKSHRDYGVASAIAKTGLSSDEHKKTLAGSDDGLLRELMECK